MPSPAERFPAVYLRFLPPLRAKCRRLLGPSAQAEDVAQEAFLRLWEAGPRLDGTVETRTVTAWLYRTCTRLAIDVLRRRRVVEDVNADDEQASPCAVAPEDAVAARRLIAALARGVPDEELEAAILCRVDGLSQPEAAEVLRASERTVRRLLERFDARTEQWRREVLS